MTATLIDNGHSTDAELVAQSRHGNREAFGRIVRRYQGMVTGVIYSFCGDFHRSEDLAQETFISAWKSLSGMNEPEKLSPWLCQIARRKTLDFQRASSREKDRWGRLFHVPAGPAPASPPQEALAAEERQLLWRVLSQLPQPYRETMVLYYRQGQSTAAVAQAMETTDDAVRQRLARGREMLREHVAATLEQNLVRSAPGPAFALVVLAALPALAPEAVKAATLGTAAAKGSATLGGGGGALSLLTTVMGPLVGLAASILAFRHGLRAAQSPPQRRFIIRFSGLMVCVLAAVVVSFLLLPKVSPRHSVWAAVLMSIDTLALAAVMTLGRRRWRAIRQRESSAFASIPSQTCAGAKMPLWLIVGMIFGGIGWMLDLAWKAGDTFSFALLAALGVTLTVVAMYVFRRRSPIAARRFTALYVPLLGAITLVMVNWKFYPWLAATPHAPSLAELYRRAPLWRFNLLFATVFVCTEVLVLVAIDFSWRDLRRQK
jgi:RNA polymerase sigma factor (sigma-70 family)